jgi:hypothetical protein
MLQKNKNAIISGAAGPIGSAVARAFAREGAASRGSRTIAALKEHTSRCDEEVPMQTQRPTVPRDQRPCGGRALPRRRASTFAARTAAQTCWSLQKTDGGRSLVWGCHRCYPRVNRASFISSASCRVVCDPDGRSEACAPTCRPLLTYSSEEIL